MKALSIKQPWATLIVSGVKPVENRTWKSNYQGPLLIHAGGSPDSDGYRWVKEHFPNVLLDDYQFPLGCIVGQVDMIDCVTTHKSKWFFGRHGFVFNNPIMFHTPIPFKGKLRFFDVPDNIVSI